MLYKNVKSYIKAMRKIADNQEIAQMRGFNKLSKEAQGMLYYLIGDIQNDIYDLEQLIDKTNDIRRIIQ